MAESRNIYLDNQATTPMDPRVLDAMLPFFHEHFGNAASSQHVWGWHAEAAVDRAREACAAIISARPKEIIFTSGATESNNLAIQGMRTAYRRKGNHLVTVRTEHHSLLDVAKKWEADGGSVTVLDVDANGMLDLNQLEEALQPDTLMVSTMAANNEIGVLHPLKEIGAITRARGIFFHTDATQAVGKIPINVENCNLDLLSFSAHKCYGPKGSGFLYIRSRNPRVRPEPIILGGGHERGMRSGTLNVPGIVGMGAALSLAAQEMPSEAVRLYGLRTYLLTQLRKEIPGIKLLGSEEARLPGNLNLLLPGIPSETLMMETRTLAYSDGAACSSAKAAPSHVLQALGLDPEAAKCAIRISIGRFNTREDIELAGEILVKAIRKLENLGAHAFTDNGRT